MFAQIFQSPGIKGTEHNLANLVVIPNRGKEERWYSSILDAQYHRQGSRILTANPIIYILSYIYIHIHIYVIYLCGRYVQNNYLECLTSSLDVCLVRLNDLDRHEFYIRLRLASCFSQFMIDTKHIQTERFGNGDSFKIWSVI